MEQVDRVQKRMQGLLNFAKPMEPRPAPVELNPLLRDIIQVLQARFTEAGVDSKLDLDRNLPKVRLDANHGEQFFTTKAHGPGIGLPLAKKFVERNGGTIRISEASSGGAKIDVAFPWNGL